MLNIAIAIVIVIVLWALVIFGIRLGDNGSNKNNGFAIVCAFVMVLGSIVINVYLVSKALEVLR